jgi:antitoxin MazE
MQTKIRKWGNSLGLRIPRSFAVEAQVEEGSTVDLSVRSGRLLKRVTPRNLHGEIATGEPVGREVW